ncbi:FtsX-like permease family protein [Paratractidigestivibacter sp.]|uniref:FtsX-like permease family protein n=1 Tax=Paratractidigestivibacter sp. TaxID=2847316 RepID=UPI002ABD1E64|nr:FtsX-like permease family protein [Paratractidigestivibacter sp.]
MLVKLALRNVRRSAREYAIYFVTLVLGVAVFYAFNAVGDSSALFEAKETGEGVLTSGGPDVFGHISRLISMLSVAVAVVLGLLVLYANRFVVRARKHEFGTYLLLGMTAPQVCAVVLMETLSVGAISLACGLALGIGVSQGLSFAAAALLKMSVANYQIIFSAGSAAATLATFAAIFLVTAAFDALQIGRCRIIILLNSRSTGERMALRRPVFCVVGFALAIAILALAYCTLAAFGMNFMSDEFLRGTALMLVGTLLLFWSGSGFVVLVLSRSDSVYLRGLRMFTVRQVAHKANTAFVSLWAVCVLLFIAITTFACGSGLASLYSDDMSESAPYDASFIGYATSEDSPSREAYQENDGDSLAWMEENCPSWSELVKTAAQIEHWNAERMAYGELEKALGISSGSNVDSSFASNPVQFVGVSQYNGVARLIGAQEIVMADDEYAVCNNVDSLSAFSEALASSEKGIDMLGSHLKASGTLVTAQLVDEDIAYSTAVLVVPDGIVRTARAEGLCPSQCTVDVMYRDGFSQAVATAQLSEECEQARESGSLWPYSYAIDPETIRSDTLALKLAITYLGLYISFVFLVTTAAVLSVQQLSEVAESIGRYRMLARLGCDRRALMASLRSQMAAYFAAPLVVALCHATCAVGVMYTSALSFAGVDPMVLAGAAGLVMGVYLLYLVCTYQVAKGAIVSGVGSRLLS